jgi:hypothetical protein
MSIDPTSRWLDCDMSYIYLCWPDEYGREPAAGVDRNDAKNVSGRDPVNLIIALAANR